jgi:hypothetical protein
LGIIYLGRFVCHNKVVEVRSPSSIEEYMRESIKHEILSLLLHLEQKNFTVKLWHEDDLVGKVKSRVAVCCKNLRQS